MPWGIAAPIAGAAVSSALAPSPSGGGGGGSYYVPTGLGTADQSWQQYLSQLQGTYQGAAPWVGTTAGDALSNSLAGNAQYGTGYMNAANAAGGQYAALGNNLNTWAGQDLATQQSLLNAGQNVYQTALDPQNALYGRTVQQLQDQTGATNSMYGLGSSAAGAGVANQALSNFNIDWQNQQLQRQLAGLQGYGQAAGVAGQYGQAGAALAQQAPQYTLAGGQVPYTANQAINTAPLGLLNQYSNTLNQGIYQPGQSQQGSIIPYLNYGQGTQSLPYQQQAQGAGAAGALISQGLGSQSQNIGNALGSYFSSPTGSFSGGDFSGAFNSNPYYSGGGNSYGFTM